MKFKNPKGEVIEVSVPAGFVEAKASGHWTHQDPLSGVVLCFCTNFTERLYHRLPHTQCKCTDDLHGAAPMQDAALPPLLPNSDTAKSFTVPRYTSSWVAQQDIISNQRIELKNLNAAFDDFKREVAKSNRNLLDARDDLRKEIQTKSARIKELESNAATPEWPKGQWWALSQIGRGWFKTFVQPSARNYQNSGHQIKFVPEGEAFLDQEAHELAIRKDEREKCDKGNGSLREDIGVLIATIDARSVAGVEALNDDISRYDRGYWHGISNAFQYAIDQLKTIVAKDQS